ncbi:hypothetical protein B484DRAFT_454251 [Ochromonadaceae sp. CCMP2298]|nr:hypothetical protein B484DRAFT_454251 [Ochromonadaceae sp. CCMP2298]
MLLTCTQINPTPSAPPSLCYTPIKPPYLYTTPSMHTKPPSIPIKPPYLKHM